MTKRDWAWAFVVAVLVFGGYIIVSSVSTVNASNLCVIEQLTQHRQANARAHGASDPVPTAPELHDACEGILTLP